MNIAATLTAMAHRQPNTVAIIHPVAHRQITYRELDDDSDLIARGLHAIGLGPGTRIALMVRPSVDFFALMFGLFKAGTIPVLIDPGIGLKPLKACLAEAEPAAFIGIPQAQAARLLFGWGRPSIRTIITVGRRWFWGGRTLDQLRQAGRNAPPLSVDTQTDDPAAILFTSGSTGIPKGALYRHGNFLAQVEMIRRTYAIEPGEIDLPTFPPFALFDPALGMTTIIPDMDASRPASADPAKLVQAIEQYGVTNMFGSPAVLNNLGRYTEAHGLKLPTLRRVLSAGAPVTPAILDRFTKALPAGVQVFTPYGATESLPVASIGSDEILGETRAATDTGAGICVGRPVEGVAVRLIEISDAPIESWDAVRDVPDGQVGEIVVRSPSVTRAYFRRDQATALAKIPLPDGTVAHRMGDLGWRDDRGRLWFCGRKSHRVVTADGVLFPEQVEGVFNAALGLRTALVGVGPRESQQPILCVEVTDKSRLDSLRILSEVGASHPLARRVQRVLLHAAPFPVDIRHNSKIFREKLAIWAAQELA